MVCKGRNMNGWWLYDLQLNGPDIRGYRKKKSRHDSSVQHKSNIK